VNLINQKKQRDEVRNLKLEKKQHSKSAALN